MLVLVIVFILTWRFLLLSFLRGRFIANAQFSLFIVLSNLSTTATLGTPKIVADVHRWPLFRVFSIKIAIKFDLPGLMLAFVCRWPLTQV